ncbi:MAG TPA: DUF998 domain-containing protein [Rubrobacter sp.]
MSDRINVLALLAIVGWAFFAASAVFLPIFSVFSFAGDYISELAIGRFGYVQTVAYFAAGLGALALGIRETTQGSWGSRAGFVMVGLFGINVLLAGIFPTDAIDAGGRVISPTRARSIHIVVSALAFPLIIAAMFVLSRTFKQNIGWRSFWPVSLVLAFAALAAFFLMGDGQWVGLYQRAFKGTIVLWLILAAVRLRSIARKA